VPTLEIQHVDPTDERALRAWWEVVRAAAAERPVDAVDSWEAVRVGYVAPRTDGRSVLVAAVEDGVAVGAGRVFLLRGENGHLGVVVVDVVPERRRQGIGTAVLAELERVAREAGRTTLVGTAATPVDADGPGPAFAAALGYAVASEEETKVVDLVTAPAGWGRLDAEVTAALDGYRVEVVDGRTPEEHLDDVCAVLSSFLGETPENDLDLNLEHWTPARIREHEERMEAMGRAEVVALAVAPDGHVGGYSDLAIDRGDPRHASVGITLVLPAHRGHRLGLAMKLATHRRLLELFPGCAYVETTNAGDNAAMNAVNEQLGYRVVERALDVQKRL